MHKINITKKNVNSRKQFKCSVSVENLNFTIEIEIRIQTHTNKLNFYHENHYLI